MPNKMRHQTWDCKVTNMETKEERLFNLRTLGMVPSESRNIGQALALLQRQPLMDIRKPRVTQDDTFECGVIASGEIYLDGKKLGTISECPYGGEANTTLYREESLFNPLLEEVKSAHKDVLDTSCEPPRKIEFYGETVPSIIMAQVHRELWLKDMKAACNKSVVIMKSDSEGNLKEGVYQTLTFGTRKSGYLTKHDEAAHKIIMDHLKLKDGEKVIVLNSYFKGLEDFSNATPEYSLQGVEDYSCVEYTLESDNAESSDMGM